MKTCTRCRRSLSVSEFTVDRTRSDGRHYYCRECLYAYRTARSSESVVWLTNWYNPHRRSAVNIETRRRYDRLNRTGLYLVDVDGVVWRWGNFRVTAFDSVELLLVWAGENGRQVKYL
jgi:hypothetical protein